MKELGDQLVQDTNRWAYYEYSISLDVINENYSKIELYFVILHSRLLFRRIKEVLKRENEERQRELRDLEAFVKKENAERKAAEDQIQGVLNAENEKRMKEAAALKEKMEREKKEMQVRILF